MFLLKNKESFLLDQSRQAEKRMTFLNARTRNKVGNGKAVPAQHMVNLRVEKKEVHGVQNKANHREHYENNYIVSLCHAPQNRYAKVVIFPSHRWKTYLQIISSCQTCTGNHLWAVTIDLAYNIKKMSFCFWGLFWLWIMVQALIHCVHSSHMPHFPCFLGNIQSVLCILSHFSNGQSHLIPHKVCLEELLKQNAALFYMKHMAINL